MEAVKTPKQRQREQETDHQQEHEQMKGHTKPRCLKSGEGRALLYRRKNKESRECCPAIGREIRIIHHREGLYQTYKYRFFDPKRGTVPAHGVFVVFGAPFPFAFSSSSRLQV